MRSKASILTLAATLFVAVALLCSADVFAQERDRDRPRVGDKERGHGKLSHLKKEFDARDADSDGFVTKEEFGGDEELFDKVDKDEDGKLSLAEVVRGAKQLAEAFGKKDRPRRGDRFAELDKDGDKKLDRSEFDGAAETFKAADADGDGKLSHEELKAYLKGLDEEERAKLSDRVRRNLAKKFEEQDKDGDGKLSADEFRGNAALLRRIDKDGDGLISLEEMTAYNRDLHSRVHDRKRDVSSDRDTKGTESKDVERETDRPHDRRPHGRRDTERAPDATRRGDRDADSDGAADRRPDKDRRDAERD